LRDEEAGGLSTVYARLFPGIEDYTAKPKILMADTEAAFDIANKIIAAYLTVARKNEPGIIADSDTEFLHDYRIALRKIRSVVSLFKGIYSDEETHRLKAEFAALMAPTGRLRDLDVYLTERQRYYDFLPDSLHDGLTVMFDMFENERTETRKTLAIWLQGDEYRLRIAELAGTFDSPAQIAPGSEAKRDAMEYARSLIWKRYRRVCRTAAAIGDDTGDEEVHELRIDCKKLRYLMEFFAPLFPARRLKGLLRPLKALQDNLGLFNDYSVQQATLERFLAGLDPRHRKRNIKVAQSIGALITILNQRQRQERGKIVASFAHFNSAAVQKEFAGIFRTKGSKA
jgi:CHAD domain-containing protein